MQPYEGPLPNSPSNNSIELNQPLVPAPLQLAPTLEPTSYNGNRGGQNVVPAGNTPPAGSVQPAGYPNLVRPANVPSPNTQR